MVRKRTLSRGASDTIPAGPRGLQPQLHQPKSAAHPPVLRQTSLAARLQRLDGCIPATLSFRSCRATFGQSHRQSLLASLSWAPEGCQKQGRGSMILLLRVRQDYTSRADEASIIRTKISMTGPFDCSLAYLAYSPGANTALDE